MTKHKRVLVLSHNSFSKTQNNGKTLESFFQNWDKNCIAQIYLQPEKPDFDFCNKYYRMTDYEILNNVFFNGKIGESMVDKVNDKLLEEKLNPAVKKLYSDRRKGGERKGINRYIHNAFVARFPLFIYLREKFWQYSKWKNDSLYNWIKEFSPDVLFFQGSSCVFGYEIAFWICNEFKIPLVLELTDDYTEGLYPWSIIERINKRKYINIFQKAISSSHKVITISDYMTSEYKEKFGGKYTVLMNSVDRNIESNEPDGFRLLYAGNVSLNRWKVLIKIGKALDDINQLYNLNCKLSIYTPNYLSENIKKALTSIDSIEYGGSLGQKELIEEVKKSNILVHVEAFNKKNKKITRLSISTKIPEYMASKRSIFAVGPGDVASIRYLRDNNYGKVVDTEDVNVIKNGLIDLINKPEVRKEYIQKAYEAYTLKHLPKISQECIGEIIESACREGI
jgi:glycosyltransferase involved in cell wall biosynthesis